MVKKKKFSRKMKLRLEICSTCMKMCRDICPTAIASASESYTPYIRTLFINLNEKKIRPIDDGALDIIFSCLTCNLCNEYCLPKVDIIELIELSRTIIVESGIDISKYSQISDAIGKFYNPLGENHSNRFDSIKDMIKNIDNNVDTLLFLGCMASYREIEIAKSSIELLNKLGIKFSIMNDERCCGSPALRTGFLNTAIKTIKHNVDEWKRRGIKNIITSCSACYRTIKTDYPDIIPEFDFNVEHIANIIHSKLDKIKLKELKAKITYHDPCHLGRAMNIYDEPREVIQRIPGINYLELDRSHEKSFCCGAGGGVRVNFPDLANEIGINRVKEINNSNVEYLISACPLCKFHFKHSKNIGKIEVLDIVELINKLL